MKYKTTLTGGLEKLTESQQELSIFECSKLIQQLASKIRQDSLNELKLCEFEDGRKKWMVAFPKYSRIKQQNLELKEENEKLKEVILKLSTGN